MPALRRHLFVVVQRLHAICQSRRYRTDAIPKQFVRSDDNKATSD
jgi:hypothetical protein